ncbi:MAG: hypothetical protein A3K03_06305 [Bdellovibrionales bacterium RIFOXYD1_FULL_44_7]|nr:MAG: hypothetical protein A3K03_06305 [Bdellovibrionales bacterium RIFOXYD1_FULL_44_7]
MKRWIILIAAATLVFAASCSTVTMTEKGAGKMTSSPTYESSKPYFFWGLVGEHHIDVKDVCENKSVKQIMVQDTFLDALLGGITLGIYRPRTAKIWCQ